MSTISKDAYESLMQFLYQAPIGLVQTAPDGTVEMINPMSARLLMPLSREQNLEQRVRGVGGRSAGTPAARGGFRRAQRRGGRCTAYHSPTGPGRPSGLAGIVAEHAQAR